MSQISDPIHAEPELLAKLTSQEIRGLASLAKLEGWPFEDYVSEVLRGHLFLYRELASQEVSDQEDFLSFNI